MSFLYLILVPITLVLLTYMFLEGRMNRLIPLELKISGLPNPFDGKTIFFISDIHRRLISEQWLDSFEQKADYIVIGGDLTERGVSFSRVRENVKRLTERGPVFFVWGNHDWDAGPDQVARILEEFQVTILNNSTHVLEENNSFLNLSGVNDSTRHYDDLAKTLASRRPFAPTILLSHNPDIQKKLNRSMDIDYVISGHTHSGQINVFGYTLKEKAGVKRHGFGTLIISSGYGTTKLPLRLGAKPDALMLRLTKK
ncbi:metallophosphoesterase [Sporolactobacillus laevolacticus]|uniref:metallophosphoesterase n=1 Tax=Sporolactobacillus laevolacticus TaxID=33018 RepID=UPI0025B5EB32|nr:metallophosphoesterase [Sporolactobacillus laevolacticus]MDN3953630.1 metallophosphoesterase [Sporolactobacillus laevolacticus]